MWSVIKLGVILVVSQLRSWRIFADVLDFSKLPDVDLDSIAFISLWETVVGGSLLDRQW